MDKRYKIPVILYESEEQSLPYIEVEKDDKIPPVLFIQEFKHTGETEPDDEGNEQPIVDILIHMYADMQFLSEKLSPERYDEVRVAMGLKPLQEARKEGKVILDKVNNNVNEKIKEKHENKESEKGKAVDDFAKNLNKRLTEKFYKKSDVSKPDTKNQKEENDKFKLRFEVPSKESDKEE